LELRSRKFPSVSLPKTLSKLTLGLRRKSEVETRPLVTIGFALGIEILIGAAVLGGRAKDS
jgi:hypothetical protein